MMHFFLQMQSRILEDGLSKLESFVALIEHFKVDAKDMTLSDLMQEILDVTGYIDSLMAEGPEEAEARIENIDELRSKIATYEETCEENNEPATLKWISGRGLRWLRILMAWNPIIIKCF